MVSLVRQPRRMVALLKFTMGTRVAVVRSRALAND